MRFKILAVTFLLMVVLQGHSYCTEENLQWVEYPKVFQTAREKDRPVLIYFYRKGCQYCKRLSEEYFNDRQIEKLMKEGFVLSKVDETVNKYLTTEFEVGGVPTIWLLSKNGERILKIPGLPSADEYKEFLDYVGSGWHKKMDIRTYLKRRADNGI